MDTVLKYILLDNETDNTASFKSGTRNRRENDVYPSFKSKFIYVMLVIYQTVSVLQMQ